MTTSRQQKRQAGAMVATADCTDMGSPFSCVPLQRAMDVVKGRGVSSR